MCKVLVVFYSYSKTTEKLAEEIALLTEGDFRELIPERPYAFDYNTAVKQVRCEMERGYCPKLLRGLESVKEYTHIFLGTPNWFKSFSPPVLTFLRHTELAGKTIVPFCTHGGGGFGNIESNIAKECPDSNMLPGFASTSDFESQQVVQWLTELGMISC